MTELTRENAAHLGQRVNGIVRRYIDAQNSIFKFSFMKAMGLKRTDPAAAAAAAEQLRVEVAELLEDVRALDLDADDPLGAFYMTLRPYLRKLDEAMEYFIGLCGRMVDAQADQNTTYWNKQHREELITFQEKEREYLIIGAKLNERWKKLTADAQPSNKG